jgi:hypothetical protein
VLVLLERKADAAATAFFREIDLFMDREGRLFRIACDDFRRAAGRCEQHILFVDLTEVVDDRRYDRGFSGSGVAFQDKDRIVSRIGQEIGDLAEENVLLVRRPVRKIPA